MKHIFSTAGLLSAIILLASACAPVPLTPQIQAQTVEVPVTVQVEVTREVGTPPTELHLAGFTRSAEETAWLKSLLYEFSLANPDIVVTYVPIDKDYNVTIQTMISVGTGPDVFFLDGFSFPSFLQNNLLLPLDDLMATTNVQRTDFIPATIDAFSQDDKTYGIPKDVTALGLYYNTDLFAAAKLDPPSSAWTWDDLRNAAQKLTNLKDPAKPVYGFGVPADAARLPVFIFESDGNVMAPDFKDTLIDSAQAISATNYYVGFRKDHIGAIPQEVNADSQGMAFGQGQFAMVLDDGWLMDYLLRHYPTTPYGVARVPSGPGGRSNLIFVDAYAIARNTKHAQVAWRLVDFLSNVTHQELLLQNGLTLPTRRALQGDEYFADHPGAATILSGVLDLKSRLFVWGVTGSSVNDQIDQALQRVYLGNQPVNEAMRQAADAIRKAIRSQ